MNRIFIFITLFFPLSIIAQNTENLTFEECINLSIEKMQTDKTDSLNSNITTLQKQNIRTAYYPKISLNGQATYQSETFSLDIPISGISLPEVPLDQYKAYLEANQILYDGGMTKIKTEMLDIGLQMSNAQAEIRKIEIKKAVSNIFFLAVLMDKQLAIINTQLQNLYEQLNIVELSIKNKILLPINKDILQAEILNVKQKTFEIAENRKAAINILSQYTGKKISDSTKLIFPDNIDINQTSLSPKLTIIDIQKQQILLNNKELASARRPKIYLFAQAGYGRPGLNMLNNEFSPYFIGGIKMSWIIFDWNNSNRNRQINMIKQDEMEIERQNTLTKLNTQQLNILAKINTTKQQIETDKRVIELNKKIIKTYQSQLKNGIITTSEYIIQLNKLTQAKLQLELHKIQLIQLKYDYTLIY